MALRVIVNLGRYAAMQPDPDRPMSGVKTAALALCAALGRRGHDVHFFAEQTDPCQRNGVAFHDRAELASFAESYAPDVLVVIPELLPLLMPLRARARVVWTGNAYTAGDCALVAPWTWAPHIGPKGERARLYTMSLLHPYTDRVIVGSQWQAQHLRDASGIPSSKLSVRYLGVSLEYYRHRVPARHRHRLVYTSEARRGLGVLLRLFPQVRAAVPEAELHIFGCEYARSPTLPDLQGAAQPGVYWRGALSKSALAHELLSAGIMAYPSTFLETFCLSVAEAQAAALPVVTSDRGALAERVSDGVDGFLIGGRPKKPEYEAAFVEAVIRLLRDDDLWARLGAEAARNAQRLYDWDVIASGWEQELEHLVAGREPLPPRLDPALDLLAPSVLRVTEDEASAQVPPALAKQWLRAAWASYGYDPNDIPGLPSTDGAEPQTQQEQKTCQAR
jgi:glycosyltransferase involved in cell wall biosynthesis